MDGVVSDPIQFGEIKPADLPAPPREAIGIVHACSNPDVTSNDLAKIITHNPVLTAELLRVVNSPFFGFAQKISSVTRAVTLLGQRALRNLVLCIAMRDAIRVDDIEGFSVQQYWESALRRAACAKHLAAMLALDPDECFTIGLLQDFGLLVMIVKMPKAAQHWPALLAADPDARIELEQQVFGCTHVTTNLLLAKAWSLPEELSFAISHHHESDFSQFDKPQKNLVDVALCADWMCSVFSGEDKKNIIHHCRERLQSVVSLNADDADELLMKISESVEQAAVAMGLEIPKQVSFDQVLRAANLRLVEENISYQELTWRLEKALAERDRYAAELQKDLDLAREVQQSLLPKDTLATVGIHGINVPAKTVSGDFYDHFTLKDGRTYFCIADVSGKGMNAALMMAKTSSLFHCLGKGLHDPCKLASMLNKEICETSIRGMFVTMVLGLLDPKIGKVQLVNAGHLPAIHMMGDKLIQQYPALSPPLGVLETVTYTMKELYLRGGSLYFVTDGLMEAKLANGKRLGREGMLNLFKKYQQLAPMQRLESILSSVEPAQGQAEDDVTIVLIQDTA